jgi:hypothetical protein
MNLKRLYRNAKVSLITGGGYDTRQKEIFGRKVIQFLRKACKLAGVTPDKRYPYFNRGGPAVLGDAYLHITLPDNSRRLEFILGEKICFETGAVYRTNSGKYWNDYGRNIWLKQETTEEDIARIIREFFEAEKENQKALSKGIAQ